MLDENDIELYNNIEDIIITYYFGNQNCNIILKKKPQLIYTEFKNGKLIGKSMGLYTALQYEKYGGAFAGRLFIIELENGVHQICQNHWWWVGMESEEFEEVGISTFENLKKCYVFMGGNSVKSAVIKKWLESNTPKTDFWYYDKLWKLKERLLRKYKNRREIITPRGLKE